MLSLVYLALIVAGPVGATASCESSSGESCHVDTSHGDVANLLQYPIHIHDMPSTDIIYTQVDQQVAAVKSSESSTQRMHIFLTQFAQILRDASPSQAAPGQVNASLQGTFQNIFSHNSWGNLESRSGSGSTVASTAGIRACLDSWMTKYKVKFLLDVPCGDANWQGLIPSIANGAVKYQGYDIAPGAVAKAAERNKANKNMQFGVLDLVNQVPTELADMIMIKEVIQHLPLAMGLKILQNAKAAGIKWLAVTSNPNYVNRDIKPGEWFPGPNAQSPPFNFGAEAEHCGNIRKTGGENDFMLFDLHAWKDF